MAVDGQRVRDDRSAFARGLRWCRVGIARYHQHRPGLIRQPRPLRPHQSPFKFLGRCPEFTRPGKFGPKRWRRRHGQHAPGARWSAPALFQLRFDPDPLSATAIRAADPDWYRRIPAQAQRDMLTHHRVRTAVSAFGPDSRREDRSLTGRPVASSRPFANLSPTTETNVTP